MVRNRQRTDAQTEQAIADFAARAEQPHPAVRAEPVIKAVPDIVEAPGESEPLPQPEPAPETVSEAEPAPSPAVKPSAKAAPRRKAAPSPARADFDVDWKRRNREPKNGGINFRASTSQLDLLRQASLVEEISQQKVLERLVWPILEERYGSGGAE